MIITIIICLIVAFLFLLVWQKFGKKENPLPRAPSIPPVSATVDTTQKTQSLSKIDTFVVAQKPKHRLLKKIHADTANMPKTVSPVEPQLPQIIDTVDTATDVCDNDTVAPWVYTDPAGGLHYEALTIKLVATKACVIQWKTDSMAAWKTYQGEGISVTSTTTLFLTAKDSCGNIMAPREEYYEIKQAESQKYCPPDMEHIKIGTTSFCMDKYEWPNKKDAIPKAYISVYQAMDTCAGAGKRLCTADEWTLACTGPYAWKYPYGSAYELYACVTNDTAVRKSGSKSECRGYFGVFDMSGNLAEWTSTRSSKNKQFYNVMGGFWESGKQSGCFDVRYSYYPQNRHNPVGFRCCKDALAQ